MAPASRPMTSQANQPPGLSMTLVDDTISGAL